MKAGLVACVREPTVLGNPAAVPSTGVGSRTDKSGQEI